MIIKQKEQNKLTKNIGRPRLPSVVNSVTEYLEHIFKITAIHEGVRCYRGECNSEWQLKPSIMRGMQADAERHIFSELMLEAPAEFSSDKSMFDKLVRAQHYGLPTRLLDVSMNPLVALYFACEHSSKECHGRVRVFDFNKSNVKFADSDAISIICNLARLSSEEKTELTEIYKKYQLKIGSTKQQELEIFRNSQEIERLLQFIRMEKPYFKNFVEPEDLFRYFFVYPIKNNRRVIAQSGAFIAAGLLKYTKKKVHSYTERGILIPRAKKNSIVKELDLININPRTMFPEVEFTSKYIKDKWAASPPPPPSGSSSPQSRTGNHRP